MSVATYEGVVENGQVKLPQDVHVPERTKVYVVVPDADQSSAIRFMSPRLADPKKIKDFTITVIPNARV